MCGCDLLAAAVACWRLAASLACLPQVRLGNLRVVSDWLAPTPFGCVQILYYTILYCRGGGGRSGGDGAGGGGRVGGAGTGSAAGSPGSRGGGGVDDDGGGSDGGDGAAGGGRAGGDGAGRGSAETSSAGGVDSGGGVGARTSGGERRAIDEGVIILDAAAAERRGEALMRAAALAGERRVVQVVAGRQRREGALERACLATVREVTSAVSRQVREAEEWAACSVGPGARARGRDSGMASPRRRRETREDAWEDTDSDGSAASGGRCRVGGEAGGRRQGSLTPPRRRKRRKK